MSGIFFGGLFKLKIQSISMVRLVYHVNICTLIIFVDHESVDIQQSKVEASDQLFDRNSLSCSFPD